MKESNQPENATELSNITNLLDYNRLVLSKEKLERGDKDLHTTYEHLLYIAEQKIQTPLVSVMDKEYIPPSGNKHDYTSLAKYYWPNPDTTNGLPYISRDGEVNPETKKYDVTALDTMTKAVRDLSFAYFYSQNARYASHASNLLRHWFLELATRMNPNFKYAQFKPGLDVVDGHGIIESHRFRWLPDNVTLLLNSGYWSEVDQQKLKNWFGEYLNWLLTSEQGQALQINPDNKGTWYTAQVVSYSLFTGNTEVAKLFAEQAKGRIQVAINPDGTMPIELKRTRSFHYHKYHLQAFFDLAVLSQRIGVDLFNYETKDGRGLRRALEFLIPYGIGQKRWPHQQIDEVRYGIMAELLHRAAIYYDDKKYQELEAKVPQAKAGDATLISYFDLVEPPVIKQ